jgi:membrane protein implicated in regulation of membrane protease activity
VTPPPTAGHRRQPPLRAKVAAGVLLAIPVAALMWVGSYAKATPRLLGFPFFYWYQLMWLFLAAGCTATAYLLLRRTRRGSDGSHRRGPR